MRAGASRVSGSGNTKVNNTWGHEKEQANRTLSVPCSKNGQLSIMR